MFRRAKGLVSLAERAHPDRVSSDRWLTITYGLVHKPGGLNPFDVELDSHKPPVQ
jgi:hypothetical protein